MAAVGRGEMRASDVARAMYPDYKEERAAAMAAKPKPESGWFGLKKLKAVKFKVPGVSGDGPAIPIRGINSDLPVRFAPNGGAVPGDRIVGILTPGEGITIYPIQSPALKEFEDKPERWLDVRWDVDEQHAAALSGAHRGAVGQRARLARADRAGDRRARRQYRQYPHDAAVAGFHRRCTIDLEVYDLKHLTSIIAQLRAKAVVAKRRAGERLTASNDDDVPHSHLRLGVNVDHVATIRNARGGRHPDPVRAAKLAIAAGADGITAHLREDRRHIRDDDIARLKARDRQAAQFRNGGDRRDGRDRAQDQAARRLPRAGAAQERTTEGGLDVVGQRDAARAGGRTSSAMPASASRCSSPPSRRRSRRRPQLGAPVIEIHTGAWCDALAEGAARDGRRRMASASATARSWRKSLGLEVHAGHGLDYATAETIAALPEIVELNIGHFLIGEAVFDGLAETVQMHARGDGPRPRARRATS